MKRPTCHLAKDENLNDEHWRRHAESCTECSELIAVGEWMTELSQRTSVQTDLPAPGYLLVKSRIRARQSAAELAMQPFYAMIILATILLIASTLMVLRTESRFAPIMTEAFWLIASHAGLLILGAFVAAIICSVAAYLVRATKENISPS